MQTDFTELTLSFTIKEFMEKAGLSEKLLITDPTLLRLFLTSRYRIYTNHVEGNNTVDQTSLRYIIDGRKTNRSPFFRYNLQTPLSTLPLLPESPFGQEIASRFGPLPIDPELEIFQQIGYNQDERGLLNQCYSLMHTYIPIRGKLLSISYPCNGKLSVVEVNQKEEYYL